MTAACLQHNGEARVFASGDEAERGLQAQFLALVCGLASLLGCMYSAYFASAGLVAGSLVGPACLAISAAPSCWRGERVASTSAWTSA